MHSLLFHCALYSYPTILRENEFIEELMKLANRAGCFDEPTNGKQGNFICSNCGKVRGRTSRVPCPLPPIDAPLCTLLQVLKSKLARKYHMDHMPGTCQKWNNKIQHATTKAARQNQMGAAPPVQQLQQPMYRPPPPPPPVNQDI